MLKLPSTFGHHMILQQGQPVPVWGMATPGAAITVTFGKSNASAVADNRGKWAAILPSLHAQTAGSELTIRAGTEAVVFKNVVVGEVWLCSGQSNMEMSLGDCNPSTAEIAALPLDQIRIFKVFSVLSDTPLDDCIGAWQEATPENIRKLTAVGAYFAAKLSQSLSVPVGIVSSAWGCSSAEAWTSREVLDSDPRFAAIRTRREETLTLFPERRAAFAKEMDAWYLENASLIPNAQQLCSGVDDRWHERDLDPSDWKPAERPFLKPAELAQNRDGVVWYRREIEIPPAWTGKECRCNLGIIDAQATVYFDGERIGESSDRDPYFWLKPADYPIPANKITPGRHTLAVRLLLQFCAGNRYDSVDGFRLAPVTGNSGEHLALSDGWTCRVACQFPQVDVKNCVIPRPWPKHNAPWDMLMPSRIYNAMLAPLAPYAMKGALWYQGEANCERAREYQSLLSALIQNWRAIWKQEHFYFGIVQLADFGPPPVASAESPWAHLREAQFLTAKTVKDTGIATAVDTGEPTNLHPLNKRPVAERLCNWALASVYHAGGRSWGPHLASCTIKGQTARITFADCAGHLRTHDGQPPRSFALAGADGEFKPAAAQITRRDTIELRADDVEKPVSVSYAWADNPAVNLVDEADYPVFPFRTDTLDVVS